MTTITSIVNQVHLVVVLDDLARILGPVALQVRRSKRPVMFDMLSDLGRYCSLQAL